MSDSIDNSLQPRSPLPDVSPEALVQQLSDENWLVRGIAAGKLRDFPEKVIEELPKFFDLTFDPKAPVATTAEAAIREARVAALPFLLKLTDSPEPRRRSRAIGLLGSVGGWCGGTTLLIAQDLEARNDSPPDWRSHADEAIAATVKCINDKDLLVRFAAASLLENLNRFVELTIPVFIEVLSEGAEYEQNWAALRLGRIGPVAVDACPALTRLASATPDSANRLAQRAQRAAQVALRKIGCQ